MIQKNILNSIGNVRIHSGAEVSEAVMHLNYAETDYALLVFPPSLQIQLQPYLITIAGLVPVPDASRATVFR